jgi:hypothetical protein
MALKSSTPNSADRRTRPTPTHPPFSRIDPNHRATVEEFEREHMGIAAKE